jgi:hypothetical protein
VEQRSEGDPGLPSISIALEAPCTQGLVEGRRTKDAMANASIDASDETISKSAASTKTVIGRLLRLPLRASERVDGRLLCRRSESTVYARLRRLPAQKVDSSALSSAPKLTFRFGAVAGADSAHLHHHHHAGARGAATATVAGAATATGAAAAPSHAASLPDARLHPSKLGWGQEGR